MAQPRPRKGRTITLRWLPFRERADLPRSRRVSPYAIKFVPFRDWNNEACSCATMWAFMDSTYSNEPARSKMSTEKRWILFVFVPLVWVLFLVLGMFFGKDAGASRIIDLVGSVALNILTFAWCLTDSNERGYTLHRHFPIATIIFGFFALIYYLFRSRGFNGGLISTAWFVLYLIGSIITSGFVALVILLGLVFTGIVSADIFVE